MSRLVTTCLFLILILTTSCSSTKKQFGLTELNITPDTALSKLEIQKIRSLSNGFFDNETYVEDDIIIKYRLFKPSKDASIKKLPLVVVFHGSGAIGSDNVSHLGVLVKIFAQPDIQKKYPSFVLAPQFSTRSSDYVMDSKRKILTSNPRACLNAALRLIDSLKSELNIDASKIYVIGFSMGGSTAINALSLRPDLFAAGISIAGIPQFDQIDELTNIPIWLIHGIDDTENPIHSDDQFYREFAGSNNIRYWRLKNTTHNDIFTSTLLGETLPHWLFRNRKKNIP